MSLGKVIRKYRKIRNLTQEEMAVRLGVTAPAVRIRLLLIKKACRLHQISIFLCYTAHQGGARDAENDFDY